MLNEFPLLKIKLVFRTAENFIFYEEWCAQIKIVEMKEAGFVIVMLKH